MGNADIQPPCFRIVWSGRLQTSNNQQLTNKQINNATNQQPKTQADWDLKQDIYRYAAKIQPQIRKQLLSKLPAFHQLAEKFRRPNWLQDVWAQFWKRKLFGPELLDLKYQCVPKMLRSSHCLQIYACPRWSNKPAGQTFGHPGPMSL